MGKFKKWITQPRTSKQKKKAYIKKLEELKIKYQDASEYLDSFEGCFYGVDLETLEASLEEEYGKTEDVKITKIKGGIKMKKIKEWLMKPRTEKQKRKAAYRQRVDELIDRFPEEKEDLLIAKKHGGVDLDKWEAAFRKKYGSSIRRTRTNEEKMEQFEKTLEKQIRQEIDDFKKGLEEDYKKVLEGFKEINEFALTMIAKANNITKEELDIKIAQEKGIEKTASRDIEVKIIEEADVEAACSIDTEKKEQEEEEMSSDDDPDPKKIYNKTKRKNKMLSQEPCENYQTKLEENLIELNKYKQEFDKKRYAREVLSGIDIYKDEPDYGVAILISNDYGISIEDVEIIAPDGKRSSLSCLYDIDKVKKLFQKLGGEFMNSNRIYGFKEKVSQLTNSLVLHMKLNFWQIDMLRTI